MEIFTFTPEELTKELNKSKEIYLTRLNKENLITSDQVEEFAKYAIILSKKSVLGSYWDFLFKGKSKNEILYHVVKVFGIKHKEEDED
jgi:hypothetical protein